MTLISRYIAAQVLQKGFWVLLGLLAVFALLELAEQMEDVGRGDYQLTDALLYVVLTLPRRALELWPVAVLVGGSIALGSMAACGELTALRGAGVSAKRLVGGMLATGLVGSGVLGGVEGLV
ncbi:MAG: LptF/LptG family permease, partial [Candidatus Competibacterales bacterium]